MTKELLKQLHQETWIEECLDHLEAEFFNPNKEIRFLGDSRYYDLRPIVYQKQKSLVERVMDERIYQAEVMTRIKNDWNDEQLKISREIEERLIQKMTARNSAVGDVDKAKQYPIDDLLKFQHGFARCVAHTEKTGSLKYYKESNSCYCFSCAKSFDAIDIYKLLNNCSFKEAVRELSK